MHPRHKQQEKPRPPSPKWAFKRHIYKSSIELNPAAHQKHPIDVNPAAPKVHRVNPAAQKSIESNPAAQKSIDVNPAAPKVHRVNSSTKSPSTVTGLLMTLLWAQLAARCSHLHRDRQPPLLLSPGNSQPLSPSRLKSLRLVPDVPQPGNAVREGDLHRPAAPTASAPGASGRPSSGLLASTSIAVFVIVSLVLATLRRRLQAKQFARPAASSRQLSFVCGDAAAQDCPYRKSRELLSKFFAFKLHRLGTGRSAGADTKLS
uniref:Transmembrane protein n=1 Tax=Macrostomum lignano TaxID=282301 RepID=A0A1I8FEI8_9PLAT